MAKKGVSIHFLNTTFRTEATSYINTTTIDPKTATFYDLEDLQDPIYGLFRQKGANATCPRDGKEGAAYIDCLAGEDKTGPSDYMLSYGWGNSVFDIIDALVDFCEVRNMDMRRTYIWMCCIYNNQHRLAIEVAEKEKLSFSDAASIFRSGVIGIKNVIAFLSPWRKPVYIQRAWCIFELFIAIVNNCNIHLIMPSREKNSLIKAVCDEGEAPVNDAMANIRAENADCMYRVDKDAIRGFIESGSGFASVNMTIGSFIRKWGYGVLEEALELAESKSQNVRSDLYLATVHNGVGRRRNSLVLLKKAIDIREEVLAEINVATLDSYNNIALVYFIDGDYDMSLKYFNKIVNRRSIFKFILSNIISFIICC